MPEVAGKTPGAVAKDFAHISEQIHQLRPKQPSLAPKQKAYEKLRKERVELLSEWRELEHQRFSDLRRAADTLNAAELAGKLRIVVTHAGDREALKIFFQADRRSRGRRRWSGLITPTL